MRPRERGFGFEATLAGDRHGAGLAGRVAKARALDAARCVEAHAPARGVGEHQERAVGRDVEMARAGEVVAPRDAAGARVPRGERGGRRGGCAQGPGEVGALGAALLREGNGAVLVTLDPVERYDLRAGHADAVTAILRPTRPGTQSPVARVAATAGRRTLPP